MVEAWIFGRLAHSEQLRELAPGGVYPIHKPQAAGGEAWQDFLTYRRRRTQRIEDLTLTSGVVNVSFEVRCWAQDYAHLPPLAAAVIEALETAPVSQYGADLYRAHIVDELDELEPPFAADDVFALARVLLVEIGHAEPIESDTL